MPGTGRNQERASGWLSKKEKSKDWPSLDKMGSYLNLSQTEISLSLSSLGLSVDILFSFIPFFYYNDFYEFCSFLNWVELQRMKITVKILMFSMNKAWGILRASPHSRGLAGQRADISAGIQWVCASGWGCGLGGGQKGRGRLAGPVASWPQPWCWPPAQSPQLEGSRWGRRSSKHGQEILKGWVKRLIWQEQLFIYLKSSKVREDSSVGRQGTELRLMEKITIEGQMQGPN